MSRTIKPVADPPRKQNSLSLASAIRDLAHGNADLALRECRLATRALEHAHDASNYLGTRKLETARRVTAIAILFHESVKGQDRTAAQLSEALIAVFWSAHQVAMQYLPFDEDFSDAEIWLEHLLSIKVLIDILVPIATSIEPANPELPGMCHALVELGWRVSSAGGDSLYRLHDSDPPHSEVVDELAIREEAAAMTASLYCTVVAMEKTLAVGAASQES